MNAQNARAVSASATPAVRLPAAPSTAAAYGRSTYGGTAVLLFAAANVTVSGNTIVGAGTDTGISVGAEQHRGDDREQPDHSQLGQYAGQFRGRCKRDAGSTATLICNTFSGWVANLAGTRQAPCITTTALPDGTVGSPYSADPGTDHAEPAAHLVRVRTASWPDAGPRRDDLRNPNHAGDVHRHCHRDRQPRHPHKSNLHLTIAQVPTVPGPPINVTATPGDGQVALSWTAPPEVVADHRLCDRRWRDMHTDTRDRDLLRRDRSYQRCGGELHRRGRERRGNGTRRAESDRDSNRTTATGATGGRRRVVDAGAVVGFSWSELDG